jgi:hypothetical protein
MTRGSDGEEEEDVEEDERDWLRGTIDVLGEV